MSIMRSRFINGIDGLRLALQSRLITGWHSLIPRTGLSYAINRRLALLVPIRSIQCDYGVS